MGSFIRQHALPLVYSVAIHVTFVVLISVSLARAISPPVGPPKLAIEATVVDEARIQAEIDRLEEAERQRRRVEADRQKQLREQEEAARRATQQEQKRLANLQAQRQREDVANKARREEEERQRQATAAKLAEIEGKRLQEEKRLEDARKAREREEDLKLAAENARRQDELQREIDEELEQQRRLRDLLASGARDKYIRAIQQKITRNWHKPATAVPGLDCTLRVNQIPGGEVVDVQVVACNGDAAVIRSIEAAVFGASPLPMPDDPSLFERNLVVEFRPEE